MNKIKITTLKARVNYSDLDNENVLYGFKVVEIILLYKTYKTIRHGCTYSTGYIT